MSLPSLDTLLNTKIPIVVCARPWARDLLAGYDLAGFIEMKGHWREDRSLVSAYKKKARHGHVRGVLLPDSLSSAMVFKFSGVPSAGYRDDGRSLILRWPVRKPAATLHAVESWHYITAQALKRWSLPVHPAKPGVQLGLKIAQMHQEASLAALMSAQLAPGRFILIAPTATGLHRGRNKVWPYFNQLTRSLQAQGHTVAMCPPPSEIADAQKNAPTALLPLDRCRRLGADVVDHSVHAAHLVDDTARYTRQHIVREGIPVGGHAVAARHGAERHDVFIRPEVAHHADAAHRQQHGERLPDLVIESGLANLLEVDGVRLSENVERRLIDGSEHADTEPGTRERVAAHHLFGQAQLAPDVADLVLEQLTQRLDQRELHVGLEAADVVVRLDRDRRSAARRERFDHVRIQRSLNEEVRVLPCAARRFLEHVDERVADDLSLLFRIFDPFERVEKASRRVDDDQLHAEVRLHGALDLLAFVQPEQARVDEHTRQLISDRLVDERRSDGRVDAAGKAADDALGAHELSNLQHLAVDERAGRPTRLRMTDTKEEVRDDLAAARRVRDFGVKLDAVDGLFAVTHGRDRHASARRGNDVARGRRVDVIAVAHPHGHRLVLLESVEQAGWLFGLELCAAVLTLPRSNDRATREVGDELHAIADGENRCDVEHRRVGGGRPFLVDRVGSAAENDAGRIPLADPLDAAGGWMNLRVHARFADASRDELRELRSVIYDKNSGRHRFSVITSEARDLLLRPAQYKQIPRLLRSLVMTRFQYFHSLPDSVRNST